MFEAQSGVSPTDAVGLKGWQRVAPKWTLCAIRTNRVNCSSKNTKTVCVISACLLFLPTLGCAGQLSLETDSNVKNSCQSDTFHWDFETMIMVSSIIVTGEVIGQDAYEIKAYHMPNNLPDDDSYDGLTETEIKAIVAEMPVLPGTISYFKVSDVLYGSVLPGDIIPIVQSGSKDQYVEAGQPLLEVGSQHLVFLEDSGVGTFLIAGGTDGDYIPTEDGYVSVRGNIAAVRHLSLGSLTAQINSTKGFVIVNSTKGFVIGSGSLATGGE